MSVIMPTCFASDITLVAGQQFSTQKRNDEQSLVVGHMRTKADVQKQQDKAAKTKTTTKERENNDEHRPSLVSTREGEETEGERTRWGLGAAPAAERSTGRAQCRTTTAPAAGFAVPLAAGDVARGLFDTAVCECDFAWLLASL